MKTVGVLALQGDFAAHRRSIEQAGARPIEVRTIDDLNQCDGLVIPGGESTTMLKLLEEGRLVESIERFSESKPIYGTCAGAILMARQVMNPPQVSLDLMDIDVERNAYGRQIDSRIARVSLSDESAVERGAPPGGEFEAVFIRAPIIRRVGEHVRVLAQYEGDPVWVEQGLHMVTTFHPELTSDGRVHRRLVEKL